MKIRYDFKKDWPRIKKQLTELSDEAKVLVKKGEKELVKLTKESKRHIDATALHLKKEHLYHLIGKEYLKSGCPSEPSTLMKQLVAEFKNIEKEMAALSRPRKKASSPRKSDEPTAA